MQTFLQQLRCVAAHLPRCHLERLLPASVAGVFLCIYFRLSFWDEVDVSHVCCLLFAGTVAVHGLHIVAQ